MSIVLSYADTHTAIIASDGRVVDDKNNIIQEDFNKTVKINPRTILGFSGEATSCQNIVKLIQNPEHKDMVESLYPEDIIFVIEKLLADAPNDIDCCFIVCGIGKNEKICSSRIQSRAKAVTAFPGIGKQCYEAAYPDTQIAGFNPFPKKLQTYFPDIMSAIKETIQITSELSPTVNNRMFYQIIQLDG